MNDLFKDVLQLLHANWTPISALFALWIGARLKDLKARSQNRDTWQNRVDDQLDAISAALGIPPMKRPKRPKLLPRVPSPNKAPEAVPSPAPSISPHLGDEETER